MTSQHDATERRLRIVLCYDESDTEQVRALATYLRAANCEPWFVAEDILPGQTVEDEWKIGLKRADVAIVCLSVAAVTNSGSFHRQWRDALNLFDQQPPGTIFLIPLRFEECDIPEKLRQIERFDLFPTQDYSKLILSLSRRAIQQGCLMPSPPIVSSEAEIDLKKEYVQSPIFLAGHGAQSEPQDDSGRVTSSAHNEPEDRLGERSSIIKPTAPKVFISYSHDSRDHSERVCAFTNRLRTEGVDCHIDQFETSPPEGWPLWMDRQIAEADFVLVVCTATYLRRFTGQEQPAVGHGVNWESLLTANDIYANGARNTKYIPVLFSDGKVEDIPRPLQGATRYWIDTPEEYDRLYRHLTNQPNVRKSELGRLRTLPPHEPKPDFFTNSVTDNSLSSDDPEQHFLITMGLRSNPFAHNRAENLRKEDASKLSSIFVPGLVEQIYPNGKSLRSNIEVRELANSNKHIILFADRGCGKTSYRFEVARIAQDKHNALIVDFDDFSSLLGSKTKQKSTDYAVYIIQQVLTALQGRFKINPEHVKRLRSDEIMSKKFYELCQKYLGSAKIVTQRFNISRTLLDVFKIAEQAGFLKIFVLVDNVDGLFESQEENKQLELLMPLLQSKPFMRADGFVFKFFLPQPLQKVLFFNGDRFIYNDFDGFYKLTWEDRLQSVITTRLKSYSNKSSIDHFQQLCDSNDDVDAYLISAAKNNPGELIRLADALIRHHCFTYNPDKLYITEATIRAVLGE